MFDSYDDDTGTEVNTHINLNSLWLKLVNKKHKSFTKLPHVKHVSRNMPEGHCGKRWFEYLHMRPSQISGSHLNMDWRWWKTNYLYLSTSKVQWHQSFWKVVSVHAQVEVAAQSVVLAVRTVCIAQSYGHVIATTIQHSVGDQDVLFNYDVDGDDDCNDNNSV